MFCLGDGPDAVRKNEKFFWVEKAFGFLLWESDKADGEGEGEMRKDKGPDGDEHVMRVTKQKCSDNVIGVGPMNSVKKLSDENKSDVAKWVWKNE